jgi:hypothetical protein
MRVMGEPRGGADGPQGSGVGGGKGDVRANVGTGCVVVPCQVCRRDWAAAGHGAERDGGAGEVSRVGLWSCERDWDLLNQCGSRIGGWGR